MLNFKSLLSTKSDTPEARRLRDEWYISALTECTDGHWDWDATNADLFISSNLRELLCYTEEDLKGRPLSWWLELIHPDDQAEIHRKIEELSTSQNVYTYFDPVRFLCKTGEYVWLENHAKVLRDGKNKILRIAGMTINTTPQKYIQNQLYRIINEQDEEAQNKMRFLSTLSHELRSPLSGIIGMTTLLKETILSSDQLHFTNNISNSTEMLLALVNDILDVTKLNSGKFVFESTSFSLATIINSAIEVVRPTILKKNLVFNSIISPDMPPFLKGDPTRLQQILVNLLSNATKFTSRGEITLRVKDASKTAQTKTSSRSIYFEITDTGIGIEPAVQENLFEEFTQAYSSTTRIYGGTGLGLSICKELVHLMGGQIGLTSEVGKGSTFWFSIPFDVGENLGQTVEPTPQTCDAQASPKKLRILLVEDNQVNQEVMSGLLAVIGDEVIIANDGKEAVELFKSNTFDAILMDLNLPIMDGLEATQEIRKLPNGNIPIIAVTASNFSGIQENCLQYNITRVLNKPIDKVMLEMALHPYRTKAGTGTESTQTQSPSRSIDPQTIAKLINDLGREKVHNLLTIYQKDATDLVAKLKSSSAQDRNTYAHTLAGMSENLGIIKVGKAAREIMGASENSPEDLPHLIQALESQFKTSISEIQGIVAPPGRDSIP